MKTSHIFYLLCINAFFGSSALSVPVYSKSGHGLPVNITLENISHSSIAGYPLRSLNSSLHYYRLSVTNHSPFNIHCSVDSLSPRKPNLDHIKNEVSEKINTLQTQLQTQAKPALHEYEADFYKNYTYFNTAWMVGFGAGLYANALEPWKDDGKVFASICLWTGIIGNIVWNLNYDWTKYNAVRNKQNKIDTLSSDLNTLLYRTFYSNMNVEALYTKEIAHTKHRTETEPTWDYHTQTYIPEEKIIIDTYYTYEDVPGQNSIVFATPYPLSLVEYSSYQNNGIFYFNFYAK